ncbi:MAG: response regulator [Anaerolineae bacterium]|nr:response regulator [Anaerolineae bacterium]
MWNIKQATKENPEFSSSAIELLQSTSRNLIFVTSVIYLLWHFVATLTWSDVFMTRVWFVTPIVLLTSVLSLWLLAKHFRLAQAVWQVGLALAITMAYYIYQQPEVTFLYVLLPLMAVVTVSQISGLLAEGLVIVLVGWLSYTNIMPPLPSGYGLSIVVGGAFTGLLGWAASHTLLTVTHWSLFNFNQAQENLKDAHQHRGEVVRVMKTLDQAYSQIERTNHMLVLARAEAEEAQEARNRFALAVSHELRTPLNFILGFSEMMVNSPKTYAHLKNWPPGLYEDIQEIYRSSTHLLRLVNDVLDLGQIEARQMTLFKETINLPQLVQEVAEMVEPVLNRKGLYFRAEIEPDLPQVFADLTRIRQVLLNLVTNSVRFTERGGVTVCLQKDDGAILARVEDTGTGIAQEDIPKLFEEFRQVGEGSWRRREGAGLGIPISRRFVQLHGGRMWAESDGVGQGTRFYFTLPTADPTAELVASPGLGVSSGKMANTRHWQSLKRKAEQERLLLILSPDPAAGELMSHYAEDCAVLALNQPDQIPGQIIELLPHALIVDQTIIEDPQVQAALQDLPYDLPVVSFIFPGDQNRLKLLPDEVSNYLVKPITRQALAKTVQNLGPDVRNLLVVDDDPAMVRFVTLALEDEPNGKSPGQRSEAGYHFSTAFTGNEALEQLQQQPPDAILLDLGLPDINGWEVLAHVRQEPELAHLPVIIITANDLPQMLQADRPETLQVLLKRPFSRPELTAILKCLMETIQPAYPAPSTSAGPAPPVAIFG